MRDVTPSGTRRIFELSQGMKGLINLGIGEPDFEVPQFVREALKSAVDSGTNRYTSNRGVPELRAQIARKLRTENGIDADPDKEIIVTAGATQAVNVLMNSLLNKGDEVVIPTPAFSAYQASVRLAGGKPVEVPMSEADGYRLNSRRLERAFNRRTKLLVLNSPANPTGTVYSPEDLTEACAAAASRGLYVLSDEIYEKFLYDGAVHFSPASVSEFKDRIVTVSGMSKTFAMTGWRLGYAVANEELVDAMTRYNMYNAVCASSIVQAAGVAALKGSQGFFRPILREFDKRRRFICQSLKEIGMNLVAPQGAFYVFPGVGRGTPDSNAFSRDFLSRYKVATIPGASFGNGGEGHIRISYALDEDKLAEAMLRLSKFKREFGMQDGRPKSEG